MAFNLHHGDCLDILRTMPDCSVDAIVTDPPYGLFFMNRKWDYDVPSVDVWAECMRVLKPGGHLLAFAGTRTHHRMAVNVEDAGFEIRDMIAWVYGSGFNKVGYIKGGDGYPVRQGWAGSLKPAMEPITLARKPLDRDTVAANVLEWGTGAMNIDGCRVGNEVVGWGGGAAGGNTWNDNNCGLSKSGDARPVEGRWPANMIHDGGEDAVRILGDASRFFYCPKATKADRDEGLDGFDEVMMHVDGAGLNQAGFNSKDRPPMKPRRNPHPTVKPTDLMRYLVRLVTTPGGTVLDPFTGSGSTGKAAILEGFEFIGIEREAEYIEIARARIAAVCGADFECTIDTPKEKKEQQGVRQLSLF